MMAKYTVYGYYPYDGEGAQLTVPAATANDAAEIAINNETNRGQSLHVIVVVNTENHEHTYYQKPVGPLDVWGVNCCICGTRTRTKAARQVKGSWIGDCCWNTVVAQVPTGVMVPPAVDPPEARTWRSKQRITVGMVVIHVPTGGTYVVQEPELQQFKWRVGPADRAFVADAEDLVACAPHIRGDAWEAYAGTATGAASVVRNQTRRKRTWRSYQRLAIAAEGIDLITGRGWELKGISPAGMTCQVVIGSDVVVADIEDLMASSEWIRSEARRVRLARHPEKSDG